MNPRRRTLALPFALIFATPAFAADWASWRGPTNDGTTDGGGIFDAEAVALEVAWQRPLGGGYSPIAVAGGRAVTLFTDGTDDYAVALSAETGDELWRFALDPMNPGRDGSDDGPLAMPVVDGGTVFDGGTVVDGGTVYALGPRGRLVALALDDGRPLWSLRLDEALGARPPHFGFTAAPLVAGDVLFVAAGGVEGRAFTGFDKRTGEVLWSTGDDWIEYHSPALATLGGRRQVVALGNERLAGLDPASGAVLWSHRYAEGERHSTAQLLVLRDDRVVVHIWPDTAAFRVESEGDAYAVTELWRGPVFQERLVLPVHHAGYLYGFDGRFLACVDAATGEEVWKSRPPGGNGLIVVDDHLVIYGARGTVVVARATPEGYEERARVQVSEVTGHTWPSFADGRIFVRNQETIAAVAVTRAAPRAAAAEAPEPANRFEAFVREVREARDKRLLVDDFMTSQSSFPVVEGDLVHFVFRGPAEDVAVAGLMNRDGAEEQMTRVEGTDLFYRTAEIEAGSRLSYYFNVDFDGEGPDPLNPRRVPSPGWWEGFEYSELVLPGAEEPAHFRPYRGEPRGTLEAFDHTSEILGYGRRVSVYLPAGYAESDARYPVLYVVQGGEWLERGHLANALDRLLGETVAPLIAVFVPRAEENPWAEVGGRRDDFLRMLAEELAPRVDEDYRTIPRREARAVLGKGYGATAAVHAAVRHGDVFGKAAAFSFSMLDDGLREAIAEATAPASLRLAWHRYDQHNVERGDDAGRESREVVDALAARGFDAAGREAPGGAGWGGWRILAAEVLAELFPPNG